MEALEVCARWRGGYAVGVEAREHRIAVDEPAESGGEDSGMMPTEVFLASLASCFCLALAWRADRDGIELPGLRVDGRAERAGRELRYGHIVLTATADVPGDLLAPLVERARRLCWVSNTLASPPAVEYRPMEVP
jgi:putative redox protein